MLLHNMLHLFVQSFNWLICQLLLSDGDQLFVGSTMVVYFRFFEQPQVPL